MNPDTNSDPSAAGLPEPRIAVKAERAKLLKLPGLMAISFYMILLSAVAVVSVVTGHAPLVYLIFSAFFLAGALGLLLLLRWAWALTLAAVALLAGWLFWSFASQHLSDLLVLGLINLVCFLYLVRSEVRKKLH